MSAHATGIFRIENWDEQPYHRCEAEHNLTRVQVKQAFHGDIEGFGSVEYILAHRADTSASFVGIQHVTGDLSGQVGSFVLRVSGVLENGGAKGFWAVVEGLGTGDLVGLRGAGRFEAPMGPNAMFLLDYEFMINPNAARC